MSWFTSCVAFAVVCIPPLLAPAGAPQDEKVALVRALKPDAKLTFKTTHAETYVVDGDAAKSLKFHGDATLEVATAAAPEAGVHLLKPAYLGVTANWWEGADKEPVAAWALTGPARTEWKDAKPRLTKERVTDVPDGFPNILGADWFDAKTSLARRLAASVSAGDGSWATHARLNLAFPPLPAEPVAKGARFDADYVAGYLGQEAQVQVFYASVVDSWTDKSVVLKQSGRAQLVKFEKPTSRRSDAVVFEVDSEKSTYSATVEVSRADGAVLKREGELSVVLKATDPAKPAEAKTVVAKIWTKLERQ